MSGGAARSGFGQNLPKCGVRTMSAFPPIATTERKSQDVFNEPNPEMAEIQISQSKSRPKTALNTIPVATYILQCAPGIFCRTSDQCLPFYTSRYNFLTNMRLWSGVFGAVLLKRLQSYLPALVRQSMLKSEAKKPPFKMKEIFYLNSHFGLNSSLFDGATSSVAAFGALTTATVIFCQPGAATYL
jgi:hypothetical protein